MLALPLIVMLAAAPTEQPVNVLVLDLDSTGLESSETKVLNDIVGESVGRKEVRVTTAADARRMIDIEAQKAMFGCESDASCLADLAGDFGARYVVYGSAAKLGDNYVVQLTLFDAANAEAVERTRVETRNLGAITSRIDEAVDDIFTPILGAPPGVPLAAYATVASGAAVVAGAVIFWLGLQPALQYDAAQKELDREQANFAGGDDSALDRAIELRSTVDAAEASWDDGATSTLGATLATLGIGATIASSLWWAGVIGGAE